MPDTVDRMRLDKWLWAARFFKTRKLAAEAVQGGKVHLNGQRTKPGKEIHPGSRLLISKQALDWEIEIVILPRQRRPATEAATFYNELPGSAEKREKRLLELRAMRAANPVQSSTRPNKKERRQIHRFKQTQ